MPSPEDVRPKQCPACGVASRPAGAGLRLHGHGLRERWILGPASAEGSPEERTASCRRYVCVICTAVMLVVPRAILPRRRYSASAIALALALYGIERAAPAQVRRRVSPFEVIGYRAISGWVTLGRWAKAVRAGALFAEVRACPASFTPRQVAERAATTLGSRAPPPMDAPLTVRAFHGAAHAW